MPCTILTLNMKNSELFLPPRRLIRWASFFVRGLGLGPLLRCSIVVAIQGVLLAPQNSDNSINSGANGVRKTQTRLIMPVTHGPEPTALRNQPYNSGFVGGGGDPNRRKEGMFGILPSLLGFE